MSDLLLDRDEESFGCIPDIIYSQIFSLELAWPCCRVQELGRYLLWRDTIGGPGLIIILHPSLTKFFYLFQGKYAHRSSDK